MPSQTIHVPADEYAEGLDGKDSDQSVSSRFAELISKGLAHEKECD